MSGRPLHILVVTQYFWPENFRINDLVEGLVERGHQVTILTGLPNYPDGRIPPEYRSLRNMTQTYSGAKVLRVPLAPRGSGSGLRLALNYLSFVLSASVLGPLRCRDKYDVAFIFEPSPITVALPALLMKKIRKMPVMFWVQDLWPESVAAAGAVSSPAVLKMLGRLVRFIYSHCDRILITSRSFIRSIVGHVPDEGQILYFPQYGEDLYRPVQLPQDAPERAKVPDGFVVMFAGNIGAAQDFETILAAANELKEHKDIHFVIIGDGRMHNKVREEVSKLQLGDTFHLLGRYPLQSMPAFFSLADAMLVTLKRDPIFEMTVPAKIQSYLACGKPIVAALDGEGAKIIDEAGAGVTCATEDPRALAAAILKLRDKTPAERDRMGVQGLQYYNCNFDRKMLIDRLESWMHELIGSNTKGTR